MTTNKLRKTAAALAACAAIIPALIAANAANLSATAMRSPMHSPTHSPLHSPIETPECRERKNMPDLSKRPPADVHHFDCGDRESGG